MVVGGRMAFVLLFGWLFFERGALWPSPTNESERALVHIVFLQGGPRSPLFLGSCAGLSSPGKRNTSQRKLSQRRPFLLMSPPLAARAARGRCRNRVSSRKFSLGGRRHHQRPARCTPPLPPSAHAALFIHSDLSAVAFSFFSLRSSRAARACASRQHAPPPQRRRASSRLPKGGNHALLSFLTPARLSNYSGASTYAPERVQWVCTAVSKSRSPAAVLCCAVLRAPAPYGSSSRRCRAARTSDPLIAQNCPPYHSHPGVST